MIDRLDNALSFFSTALELRQTRQRVLASNIANNDTPGYKARDFDFNAALDKALKASPGSADGQGLSLTRTDSQHIEARGAAVIPAIDMQYAVPTQSALDGNTVDMDVQRVKFMKNSLHYRTDLQFLGGTIKGLKTAMRPVK